MPRGVPLTCCKLCGNPVESRDELTASGYHQACAERKQADYINQLIEHRGPYFDHWRKRCLAAFGVALVDSPTNVT